MADKLTEAFDKWKAANPDRAEDDFASFQGGFTAGAVSMRERALKFVQASAKAGKVDNVNALINAIGSLSDIPA